MKRRQGDEIQIDRKSRKQGERQRGGKRDKFDKHDKFSKILYRKGEDFEENFVTLLS